MNKFYAAKDENSGLYLSYFGKDKLTGYLVADIEDAKKLSKDDLLCLQGKCDKFYFNVDGILEELSNVKLVVGQIEIKKQWCSIGRE